MIWHPSVMGHIVRSLARYWGLTLLNITGLAIGFTAVFIISLYVKDELTYDRFMPEAERVSMLVSWYGAPDRPLVSSDKSPAGIAHWLKADPSIEAVSRLHSVDLPMRTERYEALEHFYWADENIFDLLRLEAVQGDLRTALSDYDTVVVTRKVAQRYFGDEAAVGKKIVLNGNVTLTVTAVLADLPSNSNLDREIFVSGKSGYSMLTSLDHNPDWLWDSVYTYVKLKPEARLSPAALNDIIRRNWIGGYNRPARVEMVKLTDLHFQPESDGQMRPRGHLDTVVAMITVGGLILLLSTVNFASVNAAQAKERHNEMAIRLVMGAQKHQLILQFVYETGLICLMALIVALALTERILPAVNAYLGLDLAMWSSPALILFIAFWAVVIGTAGGTSPALKPSALSAAYTSHRGYGDGGANSVSQFSWLTVQFCLVITLLISAHTVQRQWDFALNKALNFNGDRTALITVSSGQGQDEAFKQQILSLDGVEGASHSRFIPVYQNIRPGWFQTAAGNLVQFTRESVDADFFALYGVELLAGKGFSGVYRSDTYPTQLIINRTALHAFGYGTPDEAIGKTLAYRADGIHSQAQIIGVVDDMRTATVREPMRPMAFDNQSLFFTMLSVRLSESGQDSTLNAIDRLWSQNYPSAGPIQKRLFSHYLKDQYHDMEQQWRVFGLLSAAGTCLVALGLSGLSIYMARARQREMAIRNALGARFWDIFRLQITPFLIPLLIANIAAAFLSWLLMSLWLSSFDAHVQLDPLSFIFAGGLTVFVTLATLSGHSLLLSPARSSQPLHID